MSNRNPVILLIDDDPDDRFLVRRAFERLGIENPLIEVHDGLEAIAYLSGDGHYADRHNHPFPGILLLDLQMPRVDGLELLNWIRLNLSVPSFLIIVLSRVDEIRQVNKAYALGANSFLIKPGSEEELRGLIASFRDYWIVGPKALAPNPTKSVSDK
jgi:CheY-like chemotaxis protein